MSLRSIWKRLWGEQGPATVVNNSLALGQAELYELLAGVPATSGVAVNEASAMRVTAVYACVRLIAGAIASLPLAMYRRTEEGRERVRNDLWWLLNEQPCATVSAAVFWEYLVGQMLLSGDAMAEIERGRGGAIRGLTPLDSRAVGVRRVDGRLRYEFCRNGVWLGRDQDDILHIPGFSFDGVRGMSVIRHAARDAIGLALAAEGFSSRFFASGAHPDVALKVPGKMTQEQIDNLRRIWASKYGGAHNASLPIVLTEGTDLQEVTLSAQDSQLIEARRFQVADIARAFGVPPHMVGETDKSTSWGSGIEQLQRRRTPLQAGEHVVGRQQPAGARAQGEAGECAFGRAVGAHRATGCLPGCPAAIEHLHPSVAHPAQQPPGAGCEHAPRVVAHHHARGGRQAPAAQRVGPG